MTVLGLRMIYSWQVTSQDLSPRLLPLVQCPFEQKQEVVIVVGVRGNIAKIVIAIAFQELCQA